MPAPTYNAPSWDESAVDTLTQKRAAPGLRAMRQQVNRVSGANFDNPNVKRMTLRDALSGYGQGVESVMGGASSAATSEYGNKFAQQSENARTGYQGQMAGWQTEESQKMAEKAHGWDEEMATGGYAQQEKMAGQAHGWDKEMATGGYAQQEKMAAGGYAQQEKMANLNYKLSGGADWEKQMQKEYDIWTKKQIFSKQPWMK